jgi:hypothetical protein
MVPASLFNALIQSVAALLIFVIGYFALLLSVVLCLLAITLISKAARVLWSRIADSTALARPFSPAAAGDSRLITRLVGSMSRHLAAAHKSGP